MSALAIPRLSPQRYLDLDRHADHRSEFLDGVMYAMAGSSEIHSLLTVAIGSELRQALRGTGCRTYSSDLRIGVGEGRAYFYPDCSVICGAAQRMAGSDDLVINPLLVVEVLSPTTEAFDRGEKFRQYQKIESLREYVLVSQTELRVEVVARQPDGEWTRTEFAGPEAICHFESIDCEISVAAIYENIALGEE